MTEWVGSENNNFFVDCFNSVKTFHNRQFNSLLLMSLSLALSSKLPIGIFYSNSILIGSLLASTSESDIKSNELKMSNSKLVIYRHIFTDSSFENFISLLF